MNRRWVHYFADSDLPQAVADANEWLGGKGAGLWRLTQAGFPVPPGFTISVDACHEYLSSGDRSWPKGLAEEIRENLRRLESETGRRFGQGENPLLVAVRSGAAVSMPGMMETILNCGQGPEDPWQSLVAAVETVFASWRSDRAAAYRRKHGITHLVGTAVNVQAMFAAELSGVLFTRDPAQPDAERMIIEGWYGLGESVVSGDVTPDRFVVDRDSLEIVDIAPGRGHSAAAHEPTGCLDSGQIAELCQLARRVEELFGHPVDIEWAWGGGQFALLQARAIRGLDIAREVEQGRQSEIARLRELAAQRRRVWVVHNLAEVLPWPTPLTWSVLRPFMTGAGGFGKMFRQLGYRPSPAVCRNGFLELICGRIYSDPDRQCDLFWDGMPLAYDLDAVAADPSLLNRMPMRFEPDKADGRFLLKLLQNIPAMWRSAGRLRRLRENAKAEFEQDALPAWLQYVQTERAKDLASLDDDQLVAELHRRCQRVLDEFAPQSLLPGFFGGMAFDSLRSFVRRLLGDSEGEWLVSQLMLSLEGDTTLEQNRMLEALAVGETEVSEFLEKFGHRCSGEMELMAPRWREDPELVLQLASRMTASSAMPARARWTRNLQRRRATEARLPELLQEAGGSCFLERVQRDLADAQSLLPYREAGKHYLMMGYELIRQVIQALAGRWPIGQGIYFLERGELARYPAASDELQRTATRRRVRWQAFQRLDLPAVIDSQDLDQLGMAAAVDAAEKLTGVALAGGVARGIVQVVHTPDDVGNLGQDYVLVCPSTDPGWTPLLVGAKGLLVERGGVLSHGAVVARDFGVPAIACADVTRRLQTGQRVRVDGSAGVITLLGERSHG